MLLHATIDKRDLDLERQVILEEIKMYDDDPEDFAHEQLILNIWPDHPLSRPITGTHESVSGITRKTLVDHIEDYYTPEKWVISIAGNFDEEQAVADFSKVLKPLKRGSKTKNETVPKMVPFESVKYRDIEQTHISIATNGIHATDPRRFQLSILDLCLGGNMSSRLFQEVREKRGLVYSINTFRESHRKNGLFGVYAAASPVHVGEILELVGKEFKRACKSGFSKQEIERGKTQLKSELLLGLESMRNRTARNAYSELFYERQLSVEELCDDINKVTAEEIHELTNQILISDQMSLVIVGPEEGLEYLPKKNLFSF
jgi:predicted Zn-dependent peptidase